MDFLFCMVNYERMRKHRKIYIAMHSVVIGFIVLPAIIDIIASVNRKLDLMIVGCVMSFTGVLLMLLVFFDSVRRMQVIVQRIPILKKSEIFFYCIFGMYFLFLIAFA